MAETVELELIAEIEYEGDADWLSLGTEYDGSPIVCDGFRESPTRQAYFGRLSSVSDAEEARERARPILTWNVSSNEITPLTVANPGALFPLVRTLPDGALLIVDRRIRTNANNIWIQRGSDVVFAFHAGDGIEEVQVTATGEIWVSRFDEGVFSDRPMNDGLSRFRPDGTLSFGSQAAFDRAGIPPIDDCYALNVQANGDAWVCYYSAFPLVKVAGDEPALLASEVPVHGASAFAVRDDILMFTGSYGKGKEDVLYYWNLRSAAVRELTPVYQGKEVRAFHRARKAGRGPELYLLEGKRLFRVPELD